MELEELKAGWNVLNERLAQNEILNKRIIKDMIVTRTNSALSRLKWMNWGGIVLVFIMFILVLIMKNIVVIRPAAMIISGLLGGSVLIYCICYFRFLERLDLNKLSIYEAMAWCIKFRKIQRCGMFVGPLVALIVIVSIFFIHHHYRSLYHMIVDEIGVLFGVCIGYLCYKYVDKKSIETIEKGLEELKEFEDE